MKVANETIDQILRVGTIFSKDDPSAIQTMLKDLAADLKEAREVRKQIIRSPMLVLTAGVAQPTRVETVLQLRMAVPEPYAAALEARALAASKVLPGSDPFPLTLVPRLGLWVLQLNDMRSAQIEMLTALARGESLEELSVFVARERVEPYRDGDWAKSFRRGGPLEWYNKPQNNDCFINVAENMDTYMAQALATLRPVKDL